MYETRYPSEFLSTPSEGPFRVTDRPVVKVVYTVSSVPIPFLCKSSVGPGRDNRFENRVQSRCLGLSSTSGH